MWCLLNLFRNQITIRAAFESATIALLNGHPRRFPTPSVTAAFVTICNWLLTAEVTVLYFQ
jgi:hypothetical protein